MVARHSDIKAVFENWQVFSSENAQAPIRPMGEAGRAVMKAGGFTAYSGLSARVPPDHTRIARCPELLWPAPVQGHRAADRRDRQPGDRQVRRRGHCDFFRDFAYDVPAYVLFRLVGVPDADVPKVKSWAVSRALLTWGDLSDEEQVPHVHNMVEYWAYCRALVAGGQRTPLATICLRHVRMQREGAYISDDEIAGVLYSVLFAGHESTTTLLTNALREVLLNRDQWETLKAHPDKWTAATEEFLRYSPSIVAWRRRALADTEIGGVAIPKGANILCCLALPTAMHRLRKPRRSGCRAAETPQSPVVWLWHPFLPRTAAVQAEFGIAMRDWARRCRPWRWRRPRTSPSHTTLPSVFPRPCTSNGTVMTVPAFAIDSRFIVPFETATDAEQTPDGWKMRQSCPMIAMGVPVPRGFAVANRLPMPPIWPQPALNRPSGQSWPRWTPMTSVDEEKRSQAIRRLVTERAMPRRGRNGDPLGYALMAPGDDLPVAVRSSATAEDMPDASFAGQHDTYLWVVGADEVVAHVRACWASLFTARAMSYRADHNLGQIEVLMAVAVQEMVDARSAGVAMTLDTINGTARKSSSTPPGAG